MRYAEVLKRPLSDSPTPLPRSALRLIFWFSVATAIYLCLYPWQFNFHRPFRIHTDDWNPLRSNGDIVDCIANFFFYFPLGFSGLLCLSNPRRRVARVTVIGLALSLFIEVMQVWVPTRDASLRDVFFNTAGAAAGAWLGRLTLRSGLISHRWSAFLPHDGFAWLLLSLWAIWQAFPFTPILRIYKLREAWANLIRPGFSLISFGDVFFGILLIAVAAGKGRPRLLAWFATALLPLQLALPEQTLHAYRLVAALLALVVATLLQPLTRRQTASLLAAPLLLWIACRSLYPFTTGEPQPWNWIPFDNVIAHFRGSLARLVAGKMLLYSGAIWTLASAGLRLPTATVLLVILLSALEAAQIYLPGHVPETTDLVLAVFGALLVAALSRTARDA